MLDFLMISSKVNKKEKYIEIFPKFIIKKSSDLMVRGGDFYAVWVENKNCWSTDENELIRIIDSELTSYVKNNGLEREECHIMYLWDSSTNMIDRWHKYCQKQMRDNYVSLDEKLIFLNTESTKKDYSSKQLPYPLEKGKCESYNKLIETLYSDEEREKIEWAIGSIVDGASKKIQKFIVLYGEAGTGKSTILNIIQQLFEGYCSVFDAKALGSSNQAFALESFKTNPLVAIQHDGDLSKIEDNTRLNSLVSHESMSVNEKYKASYENRFISFLFMGTNKPVKITDAKSGLLRRLIDVSPSGNRLGLSEYNNLVENVKFELGAIAYKCLSFFRENKTKYKNYVPTNMLAASNDFYNFILDSYLYFQKEEGITLKNAWDLYKTYCDYAKVNYPFSQRVFKEELKNYFVEYKERHTTLDGDRVRSYYLTFKHDKFEKMHEEDNSYTIQLLSEKESLQKSTLNTIFANCKTQYANKEGKPTKKWMEITSTLSDMDSTKTHYVKPPKNHIVIDFDLKNDKGEKDLKLNLKEASKWPKTYSEVSNSGKGVHLHYSYTGDVSLLNRLYDTDIEIKVFLGNATLRRRLSKCNNLPVEEISSGLPLKERKPEMLDITNYQNERHLRTIIGKNLNKEIHSSTKSSIDFIYKILEDAYESGMPYDVTDMRNAIFAFAANSSNQSDYCLKLVNKMQFRSENIQDEDFDPDDSLEDLVLFDTEVFPNLFIVNWKYYGDDKPIVEMINPSPEEIEQFIKLKLVGFNNRRYDNHILYARSIGYSLEQLYVLSNSIIKGNKGCYFGEAYNISYTDVYDFSSEKKSLKKWEIELGIHHEELGLPWDQPVKEELWPKVSKYCNNDVIALEAVFNARMGDFTARKILADILGASYNTTTNTLSTKIIFGNDKNPQSEFEYRFLGDESQIDMSKSDPKNHEYFDSKGRPIFKGYEFKNGKSTYRGEEVGEGGLVYSEPGYYELVKYYDVGSMHPFSAIKENIFGDRYTARFKELVDARIAIKHGDFELAKTMLGGVLNKYLNDKSIAKQLAYALKIVINSIYGLTSAKFDNLARHPKNIDNIVAKRGALFMINLKHRIQDMGYKVIHIKTDSIKVEHPSKELEEFIIDYGHKYGYNFELEDSYRKMCLVNKAVYIARRDIPEDSKENPWVSVGTQFAVPYVYKTLFTKEDIVFNDLCETKSVVKGAIYLDHNEKLPNVSEYELIRSIRNNEFKRELTKKEIRLSEEYSRLSDEELNLLIDEGHNLQFVGRVGLFTPIQEGHDAGLLYCKNGDKLSSITGTKGYRWLTSESIKGTNLEKYIDYSYYEGLVEDAVNEIEKYIPYNNLIEYEYEVPF